MLEALDVNVAVADDVWRQSSGNLGCAVRGDVMIGAHHDANHLLYELGVVLDNVFAREQAGELVASLEDALCFFERDHVQQQRGVTIEQQADGGGVGRECGVDLLLLHRGDE